MAEPDQAGRFRVFVSGREGDALATSRRNAAATSTDWRDVPSTLLPRSTEHFTVSYDPSLGQTGERLAEDVLATCEGDYAALQSWFGGITPGGLPFNVSIKPGDTGASHSGCAGTDLGCDAFDGSVSDVVRGEVVAEVAEVFMANQAAGWDCSHSNGEALSRVLSAERYPGGQNPPGGYFFATAPIWLNSAHRVDWVDQNQLNDIDPFAVGCGTLFINWLHYQLGFDLARIVQIGGATLGEVCRRLTGWVDGFEQFKTTVDVQFPGESLLQTDNSFPFGPTTDGVLLQGMRSGPVWVIFGNARFQVPDAATRERLYPTSPVIQIAPNILMFDTALIPLHGTLLREESSPVIWEVGGPPPPPATRRVVPPGTRGEVHVVPNGALAQIPIGLGYVEGQVTDAVGRAIPAAVIVTQPTGFLLELSSSQSGYLTPVLEPGDYDVGVIQGGYVPVSATVSVPLGSIVQQNFVLDVTLPFNLAGSVTDTHGAAIPQATVTLVENAPIPGILKATTDDTGQYAFTMDPGPYAGTYTITAEALGFGSGSVAITVPNGATIVQNFVLQALGSISGRITDANGQAVTGARVETGGVTVYADSGGLYTLTDLMSGTYNVTVDASGFQNASATVTVSPGTTTEADFVLASEVFGRIAGVIDAADTGRPLAGATVSVGTLSTHSGADGTYVLGNVPAGSAQVTAGAPRYAPDTQFVEVAASGTTTTDFLLYRLHPPGPPPHPPGPPPHPPGPPPQTPPS